MSEQAAPADSQQSIEQRVGNWLSSPETMMKDAKPPAQTEVPQPDQPTTETEATSETPEGEPTAPPFEEVEYEGRTYQVPPELKEAIIRQSDYTRKTQEVADQRKSVEHQQTQLRAAALQQEFDKEVSAERQQLQMLDYVIGERTKANWQAMGTDELIRARMELDQLKDQRSAVDAEIGKKQQSHMVKLQEQLKAVKEQANAILKQRIPQWSEATAKEVREWALSNGFTNEEVSSIHDPRHAEVLWKARQYDMAKNKATPVVQSKTAKVSSSNPMPQQTKDFLNFRKAVAKTEGNASQRKAVVEQRVADIFKKR